MNRRHQKNNSNLTRRAYRNRKKPFYKKKSFITIISLLIICLIGGGAYLLNNRSTEAPKVEHKASNKKTNIKLKKVTPRKKTTKKSKKQNPQSVRDETKSDEQNNEEAKGNAGSDDKSIKDPGSYNELVYSSDWFTFKLSNDVKLIKDANGDPALMINYNYTNKTQSPQNPSQIQSKYMILKQNDQQLSATQATGDNAGIIDSSNKDQVQPGKSFDGALLVKVNNTDDDVIMSFLNIQTNQPIQTTQPFKLS